MNSKSSPISAFVLPSALALAFALSLASVGCSKEKSTSESLDQLKAETKKVAQEVDDYTFAHRVEFSGRVQSQLTAINMELTELEARVAKNGGEAKTDAEARIKLLRNKTSDLGKQIDQLKDATESNWDSVKSATKKGLVEIQDQFKQVRQWMSEKIAP